MSLSQLTARARAQPARWLPDATRQAAICAYAWPRGPVPQRRGRRRGGPFLAL